MRRARISQVPADTCAYSPTLPRLLCALSVLVCFAGPSSAHQPSLNAWLQVSDMRRARIVAGALVEGDDDAQEGNAGSWINTVLMLEEVSLCMCM